LGKNKNHGTAMLEINRITRDSFKGKGGPSPEGGKSTREPKTEEAACLRDVAWEDYLALESKPEKKN